MKKPIAEKPNTKKQPRGAPCFLRVLHLRRVLPFPLAAALLPEIAICLGWMPTGWWTPRKLGLLPGSSTIAAIPIVALESLSMDWDDVTFAFMPKKTSPPGAKSRTIIVFKRILLSRPCLATVGRQRAQVGWTGLVV